MKVLYIFLWGLSLILSYSLGSRSPEGPKNKILPQAQSKNKLVLNAPISSFKKSNEITRISLDGKIVHKDPDKVNQLIQELNDGNYLEKLESYHEFWQQVDLMELHEIKSCLDLLLEPGRGSSTHYLRKMLYFKWASSDPPDTLNFILKNDKGRKDIAVLDQWSKEEPEKALEWAKYNALEITRHYGIGAVIKNFSLQFGFAKALEELKTIPSEQKYATRSGIEDSLANAEEYEAYINTLESNEEFHGFVWAAYSSWLFKDSENALKRLQECKMENTKKYILNDLKRVYPEKYEQWKTIQLDRHKELKK